MTYTTTITGSDLAIQLSAPALTVDLTKTGAQGAAGPTGPSSGSLEAIADSKSVTALDVLVYDTSKDSDGGAWRNRTQHTSWYNETLGTLTRGSRKEFPAVAVIVAEAAKVTIYDGDDPDLPMWMVFTVAANKMLFVSGTVTSASIAARNGDMYVGHASSLLKRVSFVGDFGYLIGTSGVYPAPNISITERNDSKTGTYYSTAPAIVNNAVYAVAMTVLPDAPIDPATGLQVPTIAVATGGGGSIIRDDGSVTSALTSSLVKVSFLSSDRVTFRRAATTAWYTSDDWKTASPFTAALEYNAGGQVPPLYTASATYPQAYTGKERVHGKTQGVEILAENPVTKAQGMVALCASDYNTGWMPGDIKGAWLADTDDTDVTGGELVTNGTFTTDLTGWTVTPDKAGDITWDASGRVKFLSDGVLDGVGHNSISATLSLTVGDTYMLSFDIDAPISGPYNSRATIDGVTVLDWSSDASGSRSATFVATNASSLLVVIGAAYNTTAEVYIDNISVNLTDADRSVNANPLIVNGTITKTAVATGADLVAYSGFSASNYLEQPYNSDLDFGTGDFSVMGWFKTTSITGAIFMRETTFNAGTGYGLYLTAGQIAIMVGSAAAVTDGVNYSNGVRRHFALVRRSGVAYLYINGVQTYSVARAGTTTDATATVRIGFRHDDSHPMIDASLSLIRVSATGPTAAQIVKIYNDEKVLFQENAACTLYGTSDAVTALAHDSTTDLLHVGTSAGRSVFQGLRRVSNTTTAVGTAISANDGLVVEE